MHNIHVLNSPVEVEEDSRAVWLKGLHTNLSVRPLYRSCQLVIRHPVHSVG